VKSNAFTNAVSTEELKGLSYAKYSPILRLFNRGVVSRNCATLSAVRGFDNTVRLCVQQCIHAYINLQLSQHYNNINKTLFHTCKYSMDNAACELKCCAASSNRFLTCLFLRICASSLCCSLLLYITTHHTSHTIPSRSFVCMYCAYY